MHLVNNTRNRYENKLLELRIETGNVTTRYQSKQRAEHSLNIKRGCGMIANETSLHKIAN